MADEKNVRKRHYYVLDENSPFVVKEAYKSARTNLIFLLTKEEHHGTVAFTSALPGEGKTLSCANLAITFAQAGSKVLIIDADMRKPQMHNIFECTYTPGLSDVLAGTSDSSCIRKTAVDNLWLLPAGTIPPNPSEMLMSHAFDKLLAAVEAAYNYVFIDLPPVGIVTDAAVVAGKQIGVVLVTRQNVTSKTSLAEAKQSIEQAGGRIIGHLFNDAVNPKGPYGYSRKRRKGNYYKYGYSGYSYGGEKEEAEEAKNSKSKGLDK